MRIGIVHHDNVDNLRQLIESIPDYQVIWIAHNGAEAVAKCATKKPDLLVMALQMPVMNGIEATCQIMNEYPCPILVVTTAIEEDAAKVFEAMGCGALDAVNMPKMGHYAEAQQSQAFFLKKIKTISKFKGLTENKLSASPPVQSVFKQKNTQNVPPLVVIGSSTGGPKALAHVLGPLPVNLEAAIVIVQHVNQEFSSGLAHWLDAQTDLKVCLATEGELLQMGTVYVAATNDHLVLTPTLCFAHTPEPRTLPYRPSVDIFFKSVALHWPEKSMAVLLTGMGRDGAKGLATLRQSGWHTIAQDEATSVVYGMPKAAKELGAAVKILPLEEISTAILNFLNSHSNRPHSSRRFNRKSYL